MFQVSFDSLKQIIEDSIDVPLALQQEPANPEDTGCDDELPNPPHAMQLN